tara:strand:+ start:307 stop:600 length:294 start_codon:yes stop_codon:yes gene_type:complete
LLKKQASLFSVGSAIEYYFNGCFMSEGQIRISVEVLSGDGEVISHEIVQTKEIKKPESAFELGFRHSEQISLIKNIQQLLLNGDGSNIADFSEHLTS